jgi:putative adhesin
MKPYLAVLLASCLTVGAETKEQINKSFAVRPGGKLVLDVDFGSVEINTNATDEVTIDVVRKVSRRNKADEEQFLREHPVTMTQEGNTVTIYSRGKSKSPRWWFGSQRTEGKYAITVPAQFNAQIKTAGGGVVITDLTGDVKAGTSGGGFKFTRLHGGLDGETSGGSIRVADCEGSLKVSTSGGGIDVSGGSGNLEGSTSGGSVNVRDFRGPAHVETSGGGINLENVTGRVNGSTSGGSISARLSAPAAEEVRFETSGGGVTVHVPESWAFDLDAATSGGGVSSDLPVTVVGKTEPNSLKGSVNGGGKSMFLRTSGGSIRVKKM